MLAGVAPPFASASKEFVVIRGWQFPATMSMHATQAVLMWCLLLGQHGSAASAARTSKPPPNAMRTDTSYDWCDCKSGRNSITVWPTGNKSDSAVVSSANTPATLAWFTFASPTRSLSWECDGPAPKTHTTTTLAHAARWWSLKATQEKKPGFLNACGALSGRLKWNAFQPAPYRTSLPFSSFDDGYACMKIPVLLATNTGTLIAFAEARNPDCGDFSSTTLVYKRSMDDGLTWGPLAKLVPELPPGTQGLCGHKPVVGNAAPVQLAAGSTHHPGRILVPHMRDNYAAWAVHSDDDGVTWSVPRALPHVVNTSTGGTATLSPIRPRL